MAKSLSGFWLSAIKRAGRSQQAKSRKLLKSLLGKPAKSVKPAKATRLTKATKAAKSATLAKQPRPSRAAPSKNVALKSAAKASTAPSAAVSSAAALPGSWKNAYFTLPAKGATAGRRMLYALYIPSSPAVAPRPLVVMLHGCQQNAADFAKSTRMNELAERKGFVVLYPQQAAASDRNRCWHWYKRATQQGLGDVDLIACMVEQVQELHGIDRQRTYVAGLSAGAGLAALMALNRPELFAAAGLHSAPVFGTADSAMSAYGAMQHGSAAHETAARSQITAHPSLGAASGLPVLLIHGSSDNVVRRVNLHQLTQQFRIINTGAVTSSMPERVSQPARPGGRYPRRASQTVTYLAGRKPQVVSCEIKALGHAWSGGDSSVAFTDSVGPDASLMLWTFFARHKRKSL